MSGLYATACPTEAFPSLLEQAVTFPRTTPLHLRKVGVSSRQITVRYGDPPRFSTAKFVVAFARI